MNIFFLVIWPSACIVCFASGYWLANVIWLKRIKQLRKDFCEIANQYKWLQIKFEAMEKMKQK